MTLLRGLIIESSELNFFSLSRMHNEVNSIEKKDNDLLPSSDESALEIIAQRHVFTMTGVLNFERRREHQKKNSNYFIYFV